MTMTIGSTAGATGGTVSCTKLTGTATSGITIKKCSPKNKTDKSASGSIGALENGGSVTWAPGGGTSTISKPSLSPAPGNPWGTCKVNAKTQSEVTEIIAAGHVTADTSGYVAPGGAFKASVCLNATTGKLSLAPHTAATF